MSKLAKALGVAIGVLAIFGTSASARKVEAGPPPAQVSELLKCRTITETNARLACFDRAAAVIGDAVARKDLVVFDRESVRKTKRGLFGFSIPNLGIFGDDDNEVEIKEIESTLVSVGTNSDGGYTFRLADGSRWSQTDGKPFALPPSKGDKIVVRKGALTSYTLRVAGQPGVKVKRVN